MVKIGLLPDIEPLTSILLIFKFSIKSPRVFEAASFSGMNHRVPWPAVQTIEYPTMMGKTMTKPRKMEHIISIRHTLRMRTCCACA